MQKRAKIKYKKARVRSKIWCTEGKKLNIRGAGVVFGPILRPLQNAGGGAILETSVSL